MTFLTIVAECSDKLYGIAESIHANKNKDPTRLNKFLNFLRP